MVGLFPFALRNLARRRLRSLVTAAGVAVAVAALFSLVSFQRGYQVGLNGELDRLGAHLLVVPKGCPYDAASIALHGANWPCYLEQAYLKTVAGQTISANANDRALTRLRRDRIGFVFQHFGLLPTLSVAENVVLPALFSRRDVRKRADELLARVGLAHRKRHRPGELSGGEMQRVAIARALIHDPPLLLADEPTGNLDSATSETILDLLRELQQGGLTVVVVTHNDALARAAGRRIVLRDGRIVEA